MLERHMDELERRDINKHELLPNPSLLTGVTAENDRVIVFSTYSWGNDPTKSEHDPNLIFYDIESQKDLDTI